MYTDKSIYLFLIIYASKDLSLPNYYRCYSQ